MLRAQENYHIYSAFDFKNAPCPRAPLILYSCCAHSCSAPKKNSPRSNTYIYTYLFIYMYFTGRAVATYVLLGCATAPMCAKVLAEGRSGAPCAQNLWPRVQGATCLRAAFSHPRRAVLRTKRLFPWDPRPTVLRARRRTFTLGNEFCAKRACSCGPCVNLSCGKLRKTNGLLWHGASLSSKTI